MIIRFRIKCDRKGETTTVHSMAVTCVALAQNSVRKPIQGCVSAGQTAIHFSSVIYIVAQSVPELLHRRMAGSRMNDKLERICKEEIK
jgi:hypothetical protein